MNNTETPQDEPSPAPKEVRDDVLLSLIESWIECSVSLDDGFIRLDLMLMTAPENPLKKKAWKLQRNYTELLSTILGDNDGWLEWFAWDCDFGRNPQSMKFSDGEELLVVGAGDLIDVIKCNPDGTRLVLG